MKGGMRYGAGRPGWHARTCDVRRVTVRELRERGDNPADSDAFVLSYRYWFADGPRDVAQRIELESTPCRFGGSRTWFRCPRCHRRCAAIYLYGWPVCRRCAQLAYPSTREDAIGRSWRRTSAIERRIGWKDGELHRKPKGMHNATYDRLRAAYWREEEIRERLLYEFVAKLLPRLTE